jgi:hypothetical protein
MDMRRIMLCCSTDKKKHSLEIVRLILLGVDGLVLICNARARQQTYAIECWKCRA